MPLRKWVLFPYLILKKLLLTLSRKLKPGCKDGLCSGQSWANLFITLVSIKQSPQISAPLMLHAFISDDPMAGLYSLVDLRQKLIKSLRKLNDTEVPFHHEDRQSLAKEGLILLAKIKAVHSEFWAEERLELEDTLKTHFLTAPFAVSQTTTSGEKLPIKEVLKALLRFNGNGDSPVSGEEKQEWAVSQIKMPPPSRPLFQKKGLVRMQLKIPVSKTFHSGSKYCKRTFQLS